MRRRAPPLRQPSIAGTSIGRARGIADFVGKNPTADDICRALEQAAAENALPVEFFARVIWQESRFNVSAVSPRCLAGALGEISELPTLRFEKSAVGTVSIPLP